MGPFREETKVEEGISMILPTMLREVFPDGYNSKLRFTFDKDVEIERGILKYPLKSGRSPMIDELY